MIRFVRLAENDVGERPATPAQVAKVSRQSFAFRLLTGQRSRCGLAYHALAEHDRECRPAFFSISNQYSFAKAWLMDIDVHTHSSRAQFRSEGWIPAQVPER